jgi:aspartate aminotransferase
MAAERGLTADMNKFFKENNDKFQKRRDVLLQNLSGAKGITPVKPEGAFYLFCDISKTGMDSATFAKRLLEEKEVAVIPGTPFGEDKYVRISFAADAAVLEEGAKRIKSWLG